MATPAITLKGRVVQHNTKAETKDGVDILKVTLELDNLVGGEAVKTPLTFAIRGDEDAPNRYPLGDTFEVTLKPSTK